MSTELSTKNMPAQPAKVTSWHSQAKNTNPPMQQHNTTATCTEQPSDEISPNLEKFSNDIQCKAPQIEIEHIVNQLREIGYIHIEKIYSLQAGCTVRFPALNKPASNRSASISMFVDGEGAYLIDYPLGHERTLWPDPDKMTSMSVADAARIEQLAKQHAQAAAQKTERQYNASKLARSLWNRASTTGTHSYIHTKGLSGLHNTGIEDAIGALLIPMWVHDEDLANVQRIFPDG